MENYKVTVAVALYNGEKYIRRCLESVIAQIYPNIEILVINDGSTDNGVQIIEKMVNPNIQIYHQKNGGLGAARNTSIEKATGEFVLCIDADDWLEPDAVLELVKAQKEYECDIVKMNYFINKQSDKIYSKRKFK